LYIRVNARDHVQGETSEEMKAYNSAYRNMNTEMNGIRPKLLHLQTLQGRYAWSERKYGKL